MSDELGVRSPGELQPLTTSTPVTLADRGVVLIAVRPERFLR
jgi:hypothetical protein